MRRRWPAMQAVVIKDLTAIRRSKGVLIPMITVPGLLLVVLPLLIGLAARADAAPRLGVMVRASARAKSPPAAHQPGGAVIPPLVLLAVGQSTGLLLATLPLAVGAGTLVWLVALVLATGGARRFTRDRMAAA